MYTEKMNFVWNRYLQDALENPYEYEAQDQFIREAESAIELLFLHLMQSNGSFTRDDVSLKKAIWMLHVDACETLRDCIKLVYQKNHRIIVRLFRDVIETLDLAAYLQSDTLQSKKDLGKWFQNDIIENAKYRD